MTINGFYPSPGTIYNLTLTPGTGSYAANFTVGVYATIAPTSNGANAVQNSNVYATLQNFGTIIGGPGGGIGAYLTNNNNGISHNYGAISGGIGGAGAVGGIGVEVVANGYFNNYGTVTGGAGGAPGANGIGGMGGVGVESGAGGMFLNGTILGGVGGQGATGGAGIFMLADSGARVSGGGGMDLGTNSTRAGGAGDAECPAGRAHRHAITPARDCMRV